MQAPPEPRRMPTAQRRGSATCFRDVVWKAAKSSPLDAAASTNAPRRDDREVSRYVRRRIRRAPSARLRQSAKALRTLAMHRPMQPASFLAAMHTERRAKPCGATAWGAIVRVALPTFAPVPARCSGVVLKLFLHLSSQLDVLGCLAFIVAPTWAALQAGASQPRRGLSAPVAAPARCRHRSRSVLDARRRHGVQPGDARRCQSCANVRRDMGSAFSGRRRRGRTAASTWGFRTGDASRRRLAAGRDGMPGSPRRRSTAAS